MTSDRQTSRNFGHRTDLKFDLEKPADRQTLKIQKILALSPNLGDAQNIQRIRIPDLRTFDEITSCYLGNRDKLRNSDESSSRTSGTSDKTSKLLIRKYTTRTSEHRNVSTCWIQNNPVSTGFPNSFDERAGDNGPFSLNKTVDIRLNDDDTDLLQCKSHECLEPSQYDRDGRCYLALQYADSTNDVFKTQPNPLEAFKWTKSLAFSG